MSTPTSLVPIRIDRTQPLPLPCWLWSSSSRQWMKCNNVSALVRGADIHEDWTHRLPGYLVFRDIAHISPPEPSPPVLDLAGNPLP